MRRGSLKHTYTENLQTFFFTDLAGKSAELDNARLSATGLSANFWSFTGLRSSCITYDTVGFMGLKVYPASIWIDLVWFDGLYLRLV